MANIVYDKIFSMITNKINDIVDNNKDNFCSDPKNTVLNKINGSLITRTAYLLIPPNIKQQVMTSLD